MARARFIVTTNDGVIRRFKRWDKRDAFIKKLQKTKPKGTRISTLDFDTGQASSRRVR